MDVAVVTSVGTGNISLFISTQQTPAVFLRLYTGIHDQAIDGNYEEFWIRKVLKFHRTQITAGKPNTYRGILHVLLVIAVRLNVQYLKISIT